MNDEMKDAIRKVVGQAVGASNSVGDIWGIYAAVTLAKGAGDIQRQECKRAFYAGAAAMLELFMQIGEPGFEEEAGIRRMEAMSRELEAFGEAIKEGRA